MLDALSKSCPWIIGLLVLANVGIWVYLWRTSRTFKKGLSAYLRNLLRPFSRQSDFDPNAPLDEQIDVFLADIRDILQDPRESEAGHLYSRLTAKDESRTYLKLHWFEMCFSIARALIEVYPLLGIVGTVLAIWAGLNASGDADPDKITRIVQNFGQSVRSTAFGLGAAIVFLILNSAVEPGFERLLTYAATVRDNVSIAKQKLAMQSRTRTGEPV
jgi:biopolymer transport protein ExbB/TolQ